MLDVNAARFDRLETKLDKMGESLTLLVRIEERMVQIYDHNNRADKRADSHSQRIANLEKTIYARGAFYLWMDRIALAFLGAASVYALQWLGT